jgi:hypothetical protein
MEAFLQTNSTIGVVFEDDVEIHSASFELLNRSLRFIEPADVLVAGCQDGLASFDSVLGSPICNTLGLFEVHRTCWPEVKRSCAYAVGRRAAEHIYNTQKEALWGADDYRILCPPFGRLLFCKAFSHPLNGFSTIQAERVMMWERRAGPKSLITRIKEQIYTSWAPRKRRINQSVLLKIGLIRPISR